MDERQYDNARVRIVGIESRINGRTGHAESGGRYTAKGDNRIVSGVIDDVDAD
jgi:hypothetical protein